MVANPIHPLCGQELVIRHITQMRGSRVVLAEHPDGGTLTFPGHVLHAARAGDTGLFSDGSVRLLLRKVDALLGR